MCACACSVRTPLSRFVVAPNAGLCLSHPSPGSAVSFLTKRDPCIWRHYLLLSVFNTALMQGPDPYLSLLQPLQPFVCAPTILCAADLPPVVVCLPC